VNDVTAAALARDIVAKIEETLAYPGQIKVVVIRESRSIEVAQ
jgi:ribonuclease Y